MSDNYKPLLDLVLEHTEYEQGNLDRVALKAVNADFTTRDGFRWAFPGFWTRDPDATGDYTPDVCPQYAGDGLSVALTAYGMSQGGYTPHTVLIVGFNDRDVLAEDTDKLKVIHAKTLALVDGWKLIRDHGRRADLRGADLRGAYLRGAYLREVYLRRADLRGTDLRGTDLGGSGPAGSVPAGNGPAGSGPAGNGPAGSGWS